MSRFYGKVDLPPDDLRKVILAVVPRASEETVDMLLESLLDGVSYDRLAVQYEIAGNIAPICRNSFYRLRRLVIAQLERR